VVLAARELAAGRITKEQYDEYVDYYTPIGPVLGSNLEAPIGSALMADILTTKIKQKKKPELINAPIADGTRVGLRMDIPALEWGRANGVNGSVVSVHEGTSPNNKTTGNNVAYRSTGHIKNVVFAPRDPERSFTVAQNVEGRKSEKTPQQTIEGDWVNTPPDVLFRRVKALLNDPAWTQVSLDPTRHAYFYDRTTRQPVVSADEVLQVPKLDVFAPVLEPTAEGREISTTQAYVRCLTQLLRDKSLGPRIVPILVDEARTFGMEGLFRQIGIYSVDQIEEQHIQRNPSDCLRKLQHNGIQCLQMEGIKP
jgi:hypothetical protein